MSEENKNEFEEQENVSPVEEDIELAAETGTEPGAVAEAVVAEAAAEEIIEETSEEAVNSDDAEDVSVVDEIIEGEQVDVTVPEKKKVSAGLVVGIICAVSIVVAIIVLLVNGDKLFNKYNRKYIDTTGRTVAEVADMMGYDYADFLAAYSLPSDMPENTYESAAMYSMPLSAIAGQYGMSIEEIKEMLGLDGEEGITEDTPWGEAQDKTTVGKFVGEDSLDQFKEQYGLGDEVTAETKWGEVRPIVDQYERDRMLEVQKAAEAENEEPEETETAAPAEDEAEESAAPEETAAPAE